VLDCLLLSVARPATGIISRRRRSLVPPPHWIVYETGFVPPTGGFLGLCPCASPPVTFSRSVACKNIIAVETSPSFHPRNTRQAPISFGIPVWPFLTTCFPRFALEGFLFFDAFSPRKSTTISETDAALIVRHWGHRRIHLPRTSWISRWVHGPFSCLEVCAYPVLTIPAGCSVAIAAPHVDDRLSPCSPLTKFSPFTRGLFLYRRFSHRIRCDISARSDSNCRIFFKRR